MAAATSPTTRLTTPTALTSVTPPSGRTGRKGHLQRRVLEADPSQEYLLYVPSSAGADLPLLVSIHGISRNSDEHAKLLSAYCEMFAVALLVPHFSEEQHPDYQRMGRRGRGRRADVALNLAVAEAASLAGTSAESFFLFGFSGGAQFAHRYAMAYPHRVNFAVFAAAGWYTMPDQTTRFPYGTRHHRDLPGVRFDAEEYLKVPMSVFVGTKDEGSAGLRHSERLDRDQGTTRVERARSWVAAMRKAAEAHHLESVVKYEEIENANHSFRRSILRSGLAERLFDTMFGPPPGAPGASEG